MVPNAKFALPIRGLTASNGGTQMYGYVDTLHYDHAIISVYMTTSNDTTNNPSVLKLSESDDTVVTNFANISGAVGDTDFTIPAADTSASAIYKFNVDLRGRKRYIKLSVTPVTTQGVHAIANLGLDMGSYSYDEIEAAFGLSCVPTENVLFGATLRFLNADAALADYTARGVAADVGITIERFAPYRFSLAWKNFYSSVNWKGNPEEKLPFLPSIGISYAPVTSLTVFASTILSTDGGTVREGSLGAEWYPLGEPLALRAGLTQRQPGDYARLIAAFGAGIQVGRFVLDYAYVLDDDALGNTQWFSGRYRY